MYITIIAIGPVGFSLLEAHEGLNAFLEKLDKNDVTD
jgi:hypothetical protein